MHKILWFVVFVSVCVWADIQKDITLNSQKIAQNQQAKDQVSQKLSEIGSAINAKNQEIIKLDSQIESLQKDINQNKDKYSSQEKSLQANKKRQEELLEKRNALEGEIVSLLSQSMAFYALSGEVDSVEDVLSREIYTILINLTKKHIKSLNQTRDTLTNEMASVSKNILEIQNSIQEQTKKRDTLEEIKAKQERIITSMQAELKIYNQKLQDINTERKNLDSILNNLKITQEQNQKKIQEKIQKEEQAQANSPKPKRTIQASKDIKIASSAYKDISTTSYRGSKTIPPLNPNTFRIEQKFGPTFDPVYKMKFFYENIILVPKNRNADVKNVLDGKVVFAKENPVIKKVIIIEHKDSLYTVYAYLDRISDTIKPGVFVKKGYTIGKVNEKLSFEVTQKDRHIDPLQLIKIN
ncbi:murein hydrolase activator EnvC family protein [uncultured Helicobacter sp.]|uniref:murein hydrolase activator EnvC family protein n=1 Tax=uncultured Helicobacter sp. TaxID=175537 RepID=UPI00374E2D44